MDYLIKNMMIQKKQNLNKIKDIIKKQEKNEINKEFLDYDFSKAVNDNEK